MKLRNKKTGEIGEPRIAYQEIYIDTENRMTYCYKTLRGVFEEWEVYEEPKEYWYIDWNGEICRSDIHDERTEQMKEIGNHFETQEKAEKAVEKLKAWKRLKEKGFKFTFLGWALPTTPPLTSYIEYEIQPSKGCIDKETREELHLIFGGEE